MIAVVSPEVQPALGDLRALGEGDIIVCRRSVRTLPVWPRYVEALASAVSKGADITWTEE